MRVDRITPEVKRLVAADRPWQETIAAVSGTPAEPLVPVVRDARPPNVPLRWHEWVNIGTLVTFGQGVQIVLVTFAVQVALVLFGLLLVPASIQAEWIGRPVTPVFSTDVGAETIGSEEMGNRRAIRFEGASYRAKANFVVDSNKPARTFTVWLSDDADRVPLRVTAHTELGDVAVELTDYSRP